MLKNSKSLIARKKLRRASTAALARSVSEMEKNFSLGEIF
jgi:hypothetical protein